MKKLLLIPLAAALCLSTACGDDDEEITPTSEPDPNETSNNNPPDEQEQKDPEEEVPKINPNSFGYLKSYIDRSAHPIFKLSGAIEAWDFNSQKKLRDTLSAHFDEIVAGNSMKYSGCVDASGNMNFNTVKQFCENAKAAGLTIYGHTLAWHSQQQPNYLMSLMADKEVDVPEEEKVEITDYTIDFSNVKSYSMWHGDYTNTENNVDYSISIEDGMLHIKNNATSVESWHVQYHIAEGLGLKAGTSYKMKINAKASANTGLPYSIGSWYPDNANGTLDVTSEMEEYVIPFEAVVDDGFVMLQTGAFIGDIWVKDITITHMGSDKRVALTAEQKRDTLIWAMDHWIQGIMEATDGFVKAWDVVNEALSGGDRDGDGVYDLQSYELNNNGDPTNVASGVFYWQYFMGDLEYMRTAVASARKHFKGDPSELKLFVNDYNLESTWDDNGKLKSLIKWIDKWEADGVTYIDGIGTQMHISCYENSNLQKDAENHIVKMFQLMANSGKLCRISELDMGYVRGSNKWGGSLKTSQVTAKEHQKMADFYKFIIEKYFEIIPPEQQYGICQWCLTDAPDNSGWRGGEPVGIWTQNYSKRKQVYQGWAEALGAKLE